MTPPIPHMYVPSCVDNTLFVALMLPEGPQVPEVIRDHSLSSPVPFQESDRRKDIPVDLMKKMCQRNSGKGR
jgi:hypothetical protein